MDNFDLKAFLIENKLTSLTKLKEVLGEELELENSLPTHAEIKAQYLKFKRDFKALISDKSKFYSDDLTAKCILLKNKEDDSKFYGGSITVVPAKGQIGTYDDGTPRYDYDFDVQDLTQTHEMLSKVLPEGWTTKDLVSTFITRGNQGDLKQSRKYVEIRSPKFSS